MPLQIHNIQVADNSSFQNLDRVVLGQQNAVAFTTGGSAGVQTLAVTFATAALPATYAVLVTPSMACFTSVTGKTTSGFNIVITPTLIASTLASGTFDVVVLA